MDRKNWEYKKLGDVAVVSAGQGAPQGDECYCDDGTPFIKAGNLEALVNGLPESEVQKVSEEVALSHRLKKYKAGSVLFAKSGMSCLKGWIYTLKQDCYVVSHLAIVTPIDSLMLSSFLNYYFIFHKPGRIEEGSDYPSISLEDIKSLRIPVPSMDDQLRVAEDLNCLNDMLSLKKKQLQEFNNLAQAMFYDMFGDPMLNDKKWAKKRLADIGKVTTGNTPSRRIDEYYNKEYMEWIKTDNIQKDALYPSKAKEYLSEVGVKKGRFVKEGSLLVSCIAGSLSSIGNVCITDRAVAFNQQINAITPNQSVLPIFLYYLIRYSGEYIRDNSSMDVKHILTKAKFESLSFPVPPLKLQQQFEAQIKGIEIQKDLVQQSIAEMQHMLDYKMDYYFG